MIFQRLTAKSTTKVLFPFVNRYGYGVTPYESALHINKNNTHKNIWRARRIMPAPGICTVWSLVELNLTICGAVMA